MAAGIPDALAHVVDKLAGAGLAASHTVGGLQVPGAWVHATGYEPLTLGGAARLDVAVDLIAEDQAEHTAISQLDGMLGIALTVITPTGKVETDAVVEFPSGALPAFRIPTTIEYTKE
ncbi:hypothetical protein [Leucobacter ruminantium]|uniref:Uncharacterized protein n=1 Tax=Leucobacter ruminantium TaxID=1289170 RepID=A0A939LWU7_9MICO|nr:hypothetical protein [Leucobacter ruminantium]MBO1805901.1 hypothetical protein [Leucobacter ruminantium]